MRVNPYSRQLLDNIVDLLNRPPVDAEDIRSRWRDAGMPLETEVGATDEETVNAYLDAWYRLVDADEALERARVLNELLATYTNPPTISNHDGSGWHMHYRPDDASLGEILAASTTVAVAEHLTAHGMHRLGRCALEECSQVYADHSRPGKQRYCSQRCANRAAVRRHRNSTTDHASANAA